jgi:branched-chain amino acid transport system permease protein
MNLDIAFILAADGLAGGAIYLLAGLGLVLVFSVTRVIFVPFGDIAVFAALSLASFQAKTMPATVALVASLSVLAVLVEVIGRMRRREFTGMARAIASWGLLPAIPCGLAWLIVGKDTPAMVPICVSILLSIPIAPLVARIALQPIADASVLVLLIASLNLHFLLSGLGLLFFGPEGARTSPLVNGSLHLTESFSVSYQTVLMIGSALVLSALFYLAFERTLSGKALRATAVNRVGARLVGIRPGRTALLAYGCASLLAGLVGVLISPVTTMYYDSGLIIGLKAFVAAIIGGLSSYPLTALGAVAVGLVESFASFWSGTMKDAIVFSVLIPALLLRSWLSVHSEEDPEEIES